MDEEKWAFVGCFPYVRSSADVPDMPSCEITIGKRTVNDVLLKKWVGGVSVVFKPGYSKRFPEWLMLLVQLVVHSLIFQIQPLLFPSLRMNL